jgi:DNA-binding PadR family transcriptional regulator
MSIRHGLLALLESGPMYGYQLRTEFEARTGGTWPLNVGQVYTTLARLERDHLVEAVSADTDGHQHYRLTDAGRAEVTGWFVTPVDRSAPPRDELAIKLALALTTPGVAVEEVVRRQRTATVRTLQDYTRLKTRADDAGDIAWLLVLDSLLFQAEAEVRWLDHCEARLARYGHRALDPGHRASSTRAGRRTDESDGPRSSRLTEDATDTGSTPAAGPGRSDGMSRSAR